MRFILGVEALMENYVEIGKKYRADKRTVSSISDLSTPISPRTFVDGIRLRLAGRTMAALNPHFFWNGYAAYGTEE